MNNYFGDKLITSEREMRARRLLIEVKGQLNTVTPNLSELGANSISCPAKVTSLESGEEVKLIAKDPVVY